MSFSRAMPSTLHGAALNAAMRALGMRLGASASRASKDIELTLVSVAAEALPHDYRVLGVLLAWLEVHQGRVNLPRLLRFVEVLCERSLERAWWAAVGAWQGRVDARWRTLGRVYDGEALSLEDADVTDLQIRRNGEDPRFVGSPLRVHAKLLRSRTADVEPPAVLARHNALYLRRLQLGSNYRADVWAALDETPEATPAEIARRIGCAYETARLVAQDWKLVREVSCASAERGQKPGRVRAASASRLAFAMKLAE